MRYAIVEVRSYEVEADDEDAALAAQEAEPDRTPVCHMITAEPLVRRVPAAPVRLEVLHGNG